MKGGAAAMTVVMITGASAGVGRAIARRFAAPGVHVGLAARNRDRLDAAAHEVRAAGGSALALPLDVADAAAVDAAAIALEEACGPIDIWINCAMVTVLSPVWNTTPEEYRRVTQVTYLGTVHGTLAALKRMRPRNRGTIVQVGSALAYRSIPLQSAYCAAKSAIVGFTDALRCELLHEGSAIKLTAVHLPAVNTPQFDWARSRLPRRPQPLPPIYDPEQVAEAIHHAAHHPRREYWLGLSAMQAILSAKLAPGLSDRILASKAWDGQMDEQPALDRPDNLHDSVPGDHAARGRFGDRTRAYGPVALSGRDGAVALGGLAVAGLAAGVLATRALRKPGTGPAQR